MVYTQGRNQENFDFNRKVQFIKLLLYKKIFFLVQKNTENVKLKYLKVFLINFNKINYQNRLKRFVENVKWVQKSPHYRTEVGKILIITHWSANRTKLQSIVVSTMFLQGVLYWATLYLLVLEIKQFFYWKNRIDTMKIIMTTSLSC